MRKLVLALLLLVATRAFPCSCVTGTVEEQRRFSAIVFVGKVASIDLDDVDGAVVTFDVLQAWSRNAPKSVIVRTSQSGAACGYLPAEGGTYIIFAHRSASTLTMGLCSHNAPIVCAKETLRILGKPLTVHAPLPDMSTWGSDDFPFKTLPDCARPPSISYGDLLPHGVRVSNLRAIVRTDGTLDDLNFQLMCAPANSAQCTPALEARVREWLTTPGHVKPATLDGKPIAVKITY